MAVSDRDSEDSWSEQGSEQGTETAIISALPEITTTKNKICRNNETIYKKQSTRSEKMVASIANDNGVVVSINNLSAVVKLIFNGDAEDPVEYGAETTIESHPEIESLSNKNGKRPRGKT